MTAGARWPGPGRCGTCARSPCSVSTSSPSPPPVRWHLRRCSAAPRVLRRYPTSRQCRHSRGGLNRWSARDVAAALPLHRRPTLRGRCHTRLWLCLAWRPLDCRLRVYFRRARKWILLHSRRCDGLSAFFALPPCVFLQRLRRSFACTFFARSCFCFFFSLLCSSGHTAALFIDERRTSLHVRAPRERLTPEASFSAVADELRSALSSASTYRPFPRTPFAADNPAFSLVTEANVHSHSGTTVASLWNTWHFFRAHSGGS